MVLSRILPLSTLVLALVGCGSVELNMPEESKVAETVEVADPIPTDPYDYQIWLAEQQTSPQAAAGFYYNAAFIAFQNGDLQVARDLLEQRVVDTNSTKQFDGSLLLSDIYLAQDEPLRALGRLSFTRSLAPFKQPQHQITYYRKRLPVLLALNSWSNIVKDRVRLSLLLPLDEREQNQIELWNALQNLTDSELYTLERYPLELLSGWVEVNQILRRPEATIDQQLQAYKTWSASNTLHPAALTPPLDFQVMGDLDSFKPSSLTVMLPMSKELTVASDAILKGIITRYYSTKGEHPTINVIDTDAYTDFDLSLDAAFALESDIIIGPLRKQNVARLKQYDFTKPLIALNQLDIAAHQENVYHFSFNPSDDIAELLSFAKREGAESGAILTLETAWATRQGDQFNSLAQQENFPIVTHIGYDDTPVGRQKAIKKLLLIDESEQRIGAVSKWLQTPVESSSRAREDLDFVFFAGKLTNAQLIRPMLDFYFAKDIPILATQTLHDAPPSTNSKPEDVERILFTEIPEVVRTAKNGGNFTLTRLSALGADSYTLANRLHLFKTIPNAKVSATTGIISLNSDNNFTRRPNIMAYQKGKLQDATSQETRYTEAN